MARSDKDTETRDPTGDNAAQRVGGEYNYGPKPDPGGNTEPGGLVPPYEDRQKAGNPDTPGLTGTGDHRPDVSEASAPADAGTGPAHVPGTSRGEDEAKGKSDEELKENRAGVVDPAPAHPDSPDMR